MTSVGLGLTVFACVFSGALLGMLGRRTLPDHHLAEPSEDVIKLATGMIATLAALVIGLLIASARSCFDTKDVELRQFAADLILLHRTLVRYGPDADAADLLLRRYTASKIEVTFPDEQPGAVVDPHGWRLLEDAQDALRALTPRTESQRWLQVHALETSANLARTRWLLREQRGGAIAMPFVLTLVFWLTVIFVSFGLFAPTNATVGLALFVCSVSIAAAVFLILEMDEPFDGVIRISSAPLRDALAHFNIR